jgi:hypothetical protein
MLLPNDGREYAKWTISTTDTLTGFQVQLVPLGPWIPATYSGGVVSLLVYGPNYVLPGDGLGTLVTGTCQPRLRCTDTPELVVRQGDVIVLA